MAGRLRRGTGRRPRTRAACELDVEVALRGAIGAALAELGSGPYAVRSSATAEDLPDASFAGLYESVLNVDGIDAVCRAVRTCVASASSTRVRATLAARVPGVAVLVQQMVPADAAGVAFSHNPVTGDHETVIEAVRGLADRLVAGEATPDQWIVCEGSARSTNEHERAIDAAQARAIASLTQTIATELGGPQDVEWALVGGRVMLLQARPITALPRKPSLALPEVGTWSKDTAHYPDLMTPFGASFYLSLIGEAVREMCATFGLMVEDVQMRSLGGEIYTRAVPLGGKEGPAPPWWLLAIVARIAPPVRKRLALARRAVESGVLEENARKWEQEWRGELRAEIERLRSVDVGRLPDDALARHLDEAIALLRRGEHVHFQVFIPYLVAVHELVAACRDLLGWTSLEALELVAGLSTASSEPARELASLADRVRANDAARAAVEPAGAALRDRLREADQELAHAFDDYCARYGTRTLAYDPGGRTLTEQPELLASLLRDAVARSSLEAEDAFAARRARAEERARRALSDRPESDRTPFDRALATGRRLYPVREDNVYWTDLVPNGVIRGIALEIGRRLVERGLLKDRGDVVHLELDEVVSALAGRSGEWAATVARRRAEQAWVLAHPGPAVIGPAPAAPPDLRGLPEPARRLNGALLWAMAEELAPRPGRPDGLGGIAGSPGRHTGVVRVVRSEAELGRLRPGEVLVCPITTPSWSIVFGIAGAVVTDGGGVLSHAAIVAREHGIPAVLGTSVATRELKDGQRVLVDGTAGEVRVGV